MYSHSSQRISASKLPPQLPQKHHQTNGTASRYSQVVTATIDDLSQNPLWNLTPMTSTSVIRTKITFGWGPVVGPIGCLKQKVLDAVSDLRGWCWLQPPVDDQATSSHSHSPLSTTPGAVEQQKTRGSNRPAVFSRQTDLRKVKKLSTPLKLLQN